MNERLRETLLLFLILQFFTLLDLSAQSWTYNATASGSDYWMTISYKSDVVCDCERKYTVSAFKDNYSPSNFLGSKSGSSRESSFKVAVGPGVNKNINISLTGTGKNKVFGLCTVKCEFSGSGTLRRSTSSLKRPASASATIDQDYIQVSWTRGTDVPDTKQGYKIARDTPDNIVKTLNGKTYSWKDIDVGPGENHTYYIYTYTTDNSLGKHTSSSRIAYGKTRLRELRASNGIARQVILNWDDISEVTEEVIIKRNGEQITTLRINSPSDTAYTDSDQGLIPGFQYEYAISWIINDEEYGMKTLGSTQPNGRISGQILTPLTQLPIVDAEVCVTLESDIEQSSAGQMYCDTTDVNGNYDIRRIYYHREASFKVLPFKENHGFDPGFYENQLLELEFPSLTLDFKDTTSFGVGGQVVQDWNGQPCGIEGIEIWVDGIYKGIKTDPDGNFILSVEESGTYTIEPRLSGHSFSPSSQTFLVDRDTIGLRFNDTKTNLLAGKVEGGCEIFIGQALVRIYSTGNEACIDTVLQTNEMGAYEISLPARPYEMEVVQLDPADGLDLDPDAVLAYFPTIQVDLTDSGKEQNFIYRRPPEIRVSGFPVNNCDNLGAAVVMQNTAYLIDVEVIESFGEASCFVESGFIVVFDEAADKANEPDTLQLEEGKATYTMIPASPNLIAPHHKLFQIVAHIDQETADWTEPMLVTGVRPREQTFTTVMPEIPLMILHDPPGDASYSFFEEGNRSEIAVRMFAKKEGSVTISSEVKLGNRFEAGQFISTKTEFWGTLGGSLSVGARLAGDAEWNISTTSLERFATSGNPRITGEEGDVFVGAAMNLVYALADVLSFDRASCQVETSVDMIMGNDGFSTTFMYTEDHIRNTLIPQLEDIREIYLDTSPDSARIYENQISVWEQVLENNIRNKRNARPAENRSFSAGATYLSSIRTDTLLSGSLEASVFIDESVAVGAGFEIAGSGAKGSVETRLRVEVGGSISGSLLKSVTTGFELNDDDPGDFFSVNIKKDPVYGTPVFDLVSGRSSCPWEKGTQPRESLQLLADSFIQSGIAADDAAVFELKLGNVSQSEETRTYILKFLQESNPDGAYVTIGGSEAQSPIAYTLPYGAERNATITVRRGPRAFSYQDLRFVLTSGCEDEIIADTVALSVSFQNSFPSLSLAKPLDNWLVNSLSDQELLVRFSGYDKDRVKKMQLQFTPSGRTAWETGAEWNASDLSNGNDGTTFKWNVVNIDDGFYDIRIRADYGDGDIYSLTTSGLIDRRAPEQFGVPEPIDGVLNSGDIISISFDEWLDCFSMNAQNIQFKSLTTGIVYPVELGCSEGKLIIRPLWNANAHRGEEISLEVRNVTDRYQNTRTDNIVWTFLIGSGTETPTVDTDDDGSPDLSDNCPLAANGNQSDLDGDGIGDACDDDLDGDGIFNQQDNCPYFPNPQQMDLDGNGIGDTCEPEADGDNDGIANDEDNCIYTYNPDQADLDGDGIGDLCDDDQDGDGLLNFSDNCAATPNPGQEDSDGDEVGDACGNTVGINEVIGGIHSFKLSPNPARDLVQVELEMDRSGTWQLELISISGQVIRREGVQKLSVGTHRIAIQVNDLVHGMYFVRMSSEAGTVARKLILMP